MICRIADGYITLCVVVFGDILRLVLRPNSMVSLRWYAVVLLVTVYTSYASANLYGKRTGMYIRGIATYL